MSTVIPGGGGGRAGGRLILITGRRPATMKVERSGHRPTRSNRGMMRPTTAILLAVSLSFPPASALAQRPGPATAAAASAATQALPPAKVPEPQFVSAGIELSGPTPIAERAVRELRGDE